MNPQEQDCTAQAAKACVLIVEDEPLKRITLQMDFSRAGWEVIALDDPAAAVRVAGRRSLDAAVIDLKMPGMDGIDLLQHLRRLQPATPVIVMTAYGNVENAVEAMKAGAVDFVTKPFDNETLIRKVESLTGAAATGATDGLTFGRIISREPAVIRVLREAAQLAGSNCPIAICGESGCGRKTLARGICHAGGRESILLIDAGCQSRAEIDSTLAQPASGSDDIALVVAEAERLDRQQQERLAALIRRRLAQPQDSAPVLVTLSGDIEPLQANGGLCEDLAHLLEPCRLYMPPLRQRKRDIPLIVTQMLREMDSQSAAVTPAAMQILVEYDWPGNVLQLRAVIERAAALAANGPIEPRHLPLLRRPTGSRGQSQPVEPATVPLNELVSRIEREVIARALAQAGGNQAKAAQILGIPRTTLRDKIAKYGLTRLWQAE